MRVRMKVRGSATPFINLREVHLLRRLVLLLVVLVLLLVVLVVLVLV